VFVVINADKYINDQPGRVLAVAVISPILLIKGLEYNDTFIKSFAVVLFIWDCFWLFQPPKSF
jgi:hypothetical protein